MGNQRRRRTALALSAIVAVAILVPTAAYAQGDPFSAATAAANRARQGLQALALAAGLIGMISCLMLGFFNKLNWRWVATGIGVSFAISMVPGFIGFLAGMG